MNFQRYCNPLLVTEISTKNEQRTCICEVLSLAHFRLAKQVRLTSCLFLHCMRTMHVGSVWTNTRSFIHVHSKHETIKILTVAIVERLILALKEITISLATTVEKSLWNKSAGIVPRQISKNKIATSMHGHFSWQKTQCGHQGSQTPLQGQLDKVSQANQQC